VRLEVDSGFGRCGLQSEDEVLELAGRATDLPGVEIVGLMGFGGQSYDAAGAEEIAAVAEAEATQLVGMVEGLRRLGAGEEISVGSTPTSPYAARVRGVTEIRPGTYVFSDRTQVRLGWGELDDCALTVLSTVVSRPTRSRAIVDVGTKGLTSDGAPVPGFGDVRDHPGLGVDGLTEEHGILSVNGEPLEIGERIQIIPNHACGALNMFDVVHVVRGGEVVDRWEVAARGRMQ
jgi:D-serine deaminase-like pyridoxal phosphate-dependent protein